MDFSGNALAPNVLMVKRRLAEISQQRCREGRGRLVYDFPVRGRAGMRPMIKGCGTDAPADLQAGFGFAPLLDVDVRAALFSSKNMFETVYPRECSQAFIEAGLVGPCPLTIYSVSPFVMLVDRKRLGDRPMPQRWSDLLLPDYRGQVVISPEAAGGNIALVSFYRMFGEEGVRSLMRNVAFSASASVMAVLPDRPRSIAASIYVIPWFFARARAAKPDEAIIWPCEGALSFPLWLLQRAAASDGARELTAYFTGEDFARESTALCLPTVCAASNESHSCEHQHLQWVGWDFLENLDVADYTRFSKSVWSYVRSVDEL